MIKQRGIILLVTLIINMVIAMLILGNMNSLLINTKLIRIFSNKQQLNIELKANHKRFVKQFSFKDSKCLYKLKAQDSYPTANNNNQWCKWHNSLNQTYQFRVWHQGVNCCYKISAVDFADFFYLQFKVINKNNNSLLISTIVRPEISDNCHCKKVSVIKDGIITQLIT